MTNLWAYIDKQKWHVETKFKIALLIVATLSALVGLAAWLIVRNWVLSTWDWMICFIGYPIVIAWIVIFLYYCNHDFHEGIFKKQ